MVKIQEFFVNLIPVDKGIHFVLGFFLFVLSNCFLSDIHSLIIVFVIALGKEIRDEFTYRGGYWLDLLFTMIPALTLVLISLLKHS